MSGPGRPRRSDVEAAVHTATIALLAERGYQQTTIDAIARRAGVGKPAIYLRWSDRPGVIADAIESQLQQSNATVPDTGDVAADLGEVLANVVALVSTTPFAAAIAALVGAAPHEPALAQALDRVDQRRRRVLRAVLTRARSEGRLRTGLSVELAIDVVLGAIYFRALVGRRAVGATTASSLVGLVLDG